MVPLPVSSQPQLAGLSPGSKNPAHTTFLTTRHIILPSTRESPGFPTKKSVCNSYTHVLARVTVLLKSANYEASLMHFSPASRSDQNILQSILFSNTHDLLLHTLEDSIIPGC